MGSSRTAVIAGALGFGALGCADAIPPPGPPPPEQPLRFVEPDAPFIVDWDPRQIATLAGAIQSPNVGAVLVSYLRGTIRLLPDCWVSGAYVGSATEMYTGALQVRSRESAYTTPGARPDALQQVSTSAQAGQTPLLDYRFVIVGRYDTSANRPAAGLLDLQERAPAACHGATHFVRAALTGAFERMTGAGSPAVQPGAFGSGGPAPAQSQHTIPVQGGDVGRCVQSGSASNASCSAFLKIELSPLQPAVAALRLTAYTLPEQPTSSVSFRFSNQRGYRQETTPFATTSGFANLTLPQAEITEDTPLVVEALQQTPQGTAVIATGHITPALLRSALRTGAFLVDLRTAPAAPPIGNLQLALSAPK